MDEDRLKTLAAAYGRDLARWPASEWAAASHLLTDRPALSAILADEGDLDRALNGWSVAAPSLALREAVQASAPRPRQNSMRGRGRGLGFWLSGAGLATAGVAGLICGAACAYAAGADARDAALVASATPDAAAAVAPVDSRQS